MALETSIAPAEALTIEEIGTSIADAMRIKILHVLSIYPKISATMLQVGIGTGISPDIWHPILERLIIDGLVDKKQVRVMTPKGRDQVYTIISLSQ